MDIAKQSMKKLGVVDSKKKIMFMIIMALSIMKKIIEHCDVREEDEKKKTKSKKKKRSVQ